MEWKRLLLSAILSVVVLCSPVLAGQATLIDTRFDNMVVAISTNIGTDSSDNAALDDLVNSITTLMTNTSAALYTATGNRLRFGSVTILGPANWYTWDPDSSLQKKGRRDVQPKFPLDQPTFETADIRVDIANTAYGDFPYTQQTGFCKERGDFIHITPKFIKGDLGSDQYGPPERLLAREWVKYFFGVFDEQGYAYSNLYPVTYFGQGATETINTCSNEQIQWTDASCSGGSSINGLSNTCTLSVDQNDVTNPNVTSSMMSLPLVPITTEFCSNASNHNSDAPNKQNIMCDGKSIMQVIYEMVPIEDQNSDDSSSPAPEFSQQKISFSNFLSLGILWDNMQSPHTIPSGWPSLNKFIMYDFPRYGFLMYLETLTVGGQSSGWKQLNTTNDRQNFLKSLSTPATKAPGKDLIGAFGKMVTNISNLDANQIRAILVITESVYSVNDWEGMCSSAKGNGASVNLISFDSTSASNFAKANCVGRYTYIQSPKSPYNTSVWDNQVQNCYVSLNERKQFDDFVRALPNAIMPAIYGPPQTYYEGMFQNTTEDSFVTISNDPGLITNRFYYETCLYFAGDDTFIIDPSSIVKCWTGNENTICGKAYDSTQTFCTDQNIDNSTEVTFGCNVFPQTVNGLTEYLPYVVYAVGQPNSSITPSTKSLTLSQWIKTDDSSLSYTTVRIFAKLTLGTTPVLNAYVTASVTSTTAQNVTIIQLRDDGSGNPDVTKSDGVYSAYFTQFSSTSTYTVTVTATDNDLSANYPETLYPWLSNTNNFPTTQTGPFKRENSAGSFYVKSLGTSGAIPPGRIMDLRVGSSDDSSVTLQWTAPGSDLDYGTVNSYVVKCSTNKDDVTVNNFGNNDQDSSIPYVNPVDPGATQSVTIPGSIDGAVHYCAVVAWDGKNPGTPSNIASYSLLQSGLTSGQIAGISIGVIIAVILIVLVGVLVFFYCYKKPKNKKKEQNLQSGHTGGDRSKLDPIAVESVPIEAIHHPGHGVENDGAQRRSRPPSTHNTSHSSFSSSGTENHTHNLGHGAMLALHNSRSPSPKPVAIPKVPTPPSAHSHPIEVIQLGAPPSHQVIFNARPHPNSHEKPDSSVFVINNPDVARPVLLAQMATIEDTGDYQDHSTFKPDIPVYNHLLTKTPYKHNAPGAQYANNESFSSTSSSSSDYTNRTPKLNSAV